VKIPTYMTYRTDHGDGRSRAVSALIIRHDTKHHERTKHETGNVWETNAYPWKAGMEVRLSAIYCLHVTTLDSDNAMSSITYQARVNLKSKQQHWSWRSTNFRRQEICNTMQARKFVLLSTDQLSRWPAASSRTPHQLDFFIFKEL
jgi:hypothetical protein